jgi:hypothetical protein
MDQSAVPSRDRTQKVVLGVLVDIKQVRGEVEVSFW